MKITFWGKGERGSRCLEALHTSGFSILQIIIEKSDTVFNFAQKLKIETYNPEDPNSSDFENILKKHEPDLFILAGYGKILKQNIINIPKIMCINLHGGKLPKYRGSSPMNWALINDEKEFSLSIIKVNSGVDTGDILMEKTFNISEASTIRDLHFIANNEFPLMLIEILKQISDNSFKLIKQDNRIASYYPLRFPEDGFILWDMLTAKEIHNRIRALTEPYPCAYTFYNRRKVMLLSSEMSMMDFGGEPGRIYFKNEKGVLVRAKDKALWICNAKFENTGEEIFNYVKRYDRFLTIQGFILSSMD